MDTVEEKKIVKYDSGYFGPGEDINPVGISVWLFSSDHPNIGAMGGSYGIRTSTVTAYDETTGIIETLNTVYVPA